METKENEKKIGKREFVGIVTSDKMNKTIVVEVRTKKLHKLYKKNTYQAVKNTRRMMKKIRRTSAIPYVSWNTNLSVKTRPGAWPRSSNGRSNGRG